MAHLGLDVRVRLPVGVTLMVTVLHCGLTVSTPDLLSAAAVLLYLGAIADPAWADGRRPVLAGVLGGVAYLCKAYALGFVLIHLGALTATRLWKGPESRACVLRQAALALAGLAIVVLPWTLVLSAKYGRFMLSDAGRLSWAYDGPSRPGYPMQRDGLIPPPDAQAVSAWDDPGRLTLPGWSPLRSVEERRHFAALVRANAASLAATVQGFSMLALPIVAASVLLVASRFDPPPARPAWTLLSAGLLYPAGYLALHLRDRFLVIMGVLLLLLGAFCVVALCRALQTGPLGRAVALAVLCLSFLPAPISGLRAAWGDGPLWPEMAQQLAAVPAGARVASNGRWRQTLYVAFHAGWRYYGEPRPGATPDEVEADLRGHGIEYFLVWGDPARQPLVARWPLVARGGGLRAYRLEPAGGEGLVSSRR
jgi:hypothetical protein